MRVMRRKESIIRMDVAMGQVDTWFFKSDGVEDLVNQFHAQHANEFIVDTAGDERDRDGHEGCSSNNTDDSSMTPAMFLRDLVRRSSEEAKVAYRRKREILPLIDKWDLRSFQQLVDVLHRTECPKPHLSLCERKALARWRNKLTERKPRDHDGVYAAAPVDRDEWARYVAYLTEHFSDKSFSAFLHFIQRCVEADFPTDPESIKRRHTWEAFHSMDLDFRRR
eukprot:gene4128-6421_t